MALDIKRQLIDAVKGGKYSLQFDESTNISNSAQLLVFVRYIFEGKINELLEEVGRIHSTTSISFTDGFNPIVPKVLALAQGKSPLAKQYLEAREEALTEDLPGMDFRAALILLPIIFKESVDHHIMMGEPNTIPNCPGDPRRLEVHIWGTKLLFPENRQGKGV
ncbi:hypothetical protein DPEC_G00295790 [Dallia pectoralis]|uniref:Uncharacterized protein n=1 Tax=Dallia pectoralis TaxID=75939 RepID=A0ACC2FIS8_DALPE|nr:hypothetical protein DPEC_G00295790 [Dallia pectoralis]